MKQHISRKILIAVSLFTILFTLCSCKSSADSSTFEGTWQFCGIVEEGSEVSAENAILGDDFLELYGLDEMPEGNLVIDENGFSNMYENVPGCEVGKRTDIDENCFTQEVKIFEIDGKTLDSPIIETTTFTLKDGYLFMSRQCSDPSLDSGDTSVYTKIK